MCNTIILVNSALSFYHIIPQHNFFNNKKQWCQGRTQLSSVFSQTQLQKITGEEQIFGELAFVHLTFGSCTSPTATFPFTYHLRVDNFKRLIFGKSQPPDKFTGKPKTQINIYIYIAHHLPIYEVNGTARYLPRQRKRPYKAIYQQTVSTCHQ